MSVNFISKLIYALKEQLGWCPKPPTVKTKDIERTALSEGILYAEGPSIPQSVLIMWVVMPVMSLGNLFLIWVLPGGIAATLIWGITYGIILLIMGAAMVVPFFRYREISLTHNKLHLKLGLSEDNISTYDIISVEPISEAKPKPLFGVLMGFLGVVKTKDAKWYVFGGGRTYIKIRRKSGKAVCVGMRDPEEFMTRWEMLQSQQVSSVDGGTK